MMNATVADRQDITDGLFILKVLPDSGVPDFCPGQYVALGLPPEAPRLQSCPPDAEPLKANQILKRAYSIGSAPIDKSGLEFYIAVVPEGVLTPRLALLKTGERLFCAPKIVGTFTLDNIPDHHSLVFVSTGTGIAPYISMLRSEATWTEGRQITLLHGVRYSSDLAYSEELRTLQEGQPRFRYHQIVSRPDESWQGERGYVQQFFQKEIVRADPTVDHIFLCGNPAMIEDVTTLLTDRGHRLHSKRSPGTLHIEKYW